MATKEYLDTYRDSDRCRIRFYFTYNLTSETQTSVTYSISAVLQCKSNVAGTVVTVDGGISDTWMIIASDKDGFYSDTRVIWNGFGSGNVSASKLVKCSAANTWYTAYSFSAKSLTIPKGSTVQSLKLNMDADALVNSSPWPTASLAYNDTVLVSNIAKRSYTVSYNANGGSGAPANQSKVYGETLVLSSTRPTKSGYSFKCWNDYPELDGVDYYPGGNYTANAALTLYAVWEQLPNVTSVEAMRVGSDVTVSDPIGGRMKVSFSWSNTADSAGNLPTFLITAVPSVSTLPTLSVSYPNSDGLYAGSDYVVLGESETYMGATVYREVRPDVVYTVTVIGMNQYGSASRSYSLEAATEAQYSKPAVTVTSSRTTSAKAHDICGEYVYLTASYASSTELYGFVASFENETGKNVTYDPLEKTGEVLLGPYTSEQLRPENAYTATVSISDKFYTTVVSKAIPRESTYLLPTASITRIDRVASDGVTPDALGGYVRISGTYTMTETITNAVPSESRSLLSGTPNGSPLTEFSPTGYTVSGRAIDISVDAPEPTRHEVRETDWVPNYANVVSGENEGLYYAQTSGIVTRSYYWSVVDLDVPAGSEISVTDAYYEANFLDVAVYDERETETFEAPDAGDTLTLSKSIHEWWGIYVKITAMVNGTETIYEYTFDDRNYIDNEYIKYLGDGVFTIPDPLPSGTTYTSIFVRYHIGSEDAIVVLRLPFEPEDGKILDDYVMTVDPSKKPAEWLDLDSTHAHFNFAKQDGEEWFERPAYSEYVPEDDGSGRLYVEFDVVSGIPSEGNNRVNTTTRTFSRVFGEFPLATLHPDSAYYVTSTVSDRFNTAQVTSMLPNSTTQTGGYFYPLISEVNPYRIGTDLLESDDGTDFRLDVNWSIYSSTTQTRPETFNVRIVNEDGLEVFDHDYDYSVTSGHPSIIYIRAEEGEDPLFSQDLQYTVIVTLTDRYSLASLSAIVTSAFFTLDVKRGGHGIAFGKPSTRQVMDIRFPGYFDQALHIAEQLSLPVYFRGKPPRNVLPSLPALVVVFEDSSPVLYLASEGSGISGEPSESEMHTCSINYDGVNDHWDAPDYSAAFTWPAYTHSSFDPGWYDVHDPNSLSAGVLSEENPHWWTSVKLPAADGYEVYSVVDAYLETDTGSILQFVPEEGNSLDDYVFELNPGKSPANQSGLDLDLDTTAKYFHFKHYDGCGWHPDSSSGSISGFFHVVYETVEQEEPSES